MSDYPVMSNDSYNEKSSSMRVVLIAEFGGFFTLLLPDSSEGRFRFTDSFGVEKFPIYFEQINGEWIAVLTESAQFSVGQKVSSSSVLKKQVLNDKKAFHINYKNQKFVLYVENEFSGDYVFLPYYFEERSDYLIGRSEQCDVCYFNPCVSRVHARLHWNGNSWSIIDQNSTNGTYVNGKKVNSAELKVGDVVFIVGLYMIIGVGFICINNLNNRITISSLKIRRISNERENYIANQMRTFSEYKFFDRTPRKLVKIDPEPINIEMPPMPIGGNNIPLLLRLGSPMLMGGHALMTGNIFMALTSMVMPTLTQGLTEKDRKEYEKKRLEKYREYLEYIKSEIVKEVSVEREQLNYNYPEINSNLQLAITEQRLWDRRKNNDDFLSVRIGSGKIPLIAKKEYPMKKFQLEPDVLETEMYEIAERQVVLEDVPIMMSLIDNFVIGVKGRYELKIRLVLNMITQLICSHSYDELKIVFLADHKEASEFNFLRYIPHNWSNDKNIRFFVTSPSDAQQLTNYLNNNLDEELNDNKKYNINNNASYVIFAFSKSLFNYVEVFKNVLESDDYRGVSVIALFDGFPKECAKVIELGDECAVVDYFDPKNENQMFNLDLCNDSIFNDGIRKITETKLNIESSNYTLPNTVTFLEMFNAGKVEHLNPLTRWAENDPVKSLAAPIGMGTDGELFFLNLHEKYQGPHGLVAGMTGSGKSEFLITYILSMAVNYSPEEVAFVLIDYKGGGLADAFENKSRGIHLPHLVGTITNLDGAAIQRSIVSIKSELMRRQAVFKKAKSKTNEGTMDIYDYQKLYRNKRVDEPMPHLFIISDEFAELKTQQPEFMNELISTARIGRSLGVHLILATQKPSGVVNDQIRSNTKFQACLRVQDRSDSMDMIKRPDAAELKNAGRFYLQVGYNEFFAQGQSAWCGAEYVPQDTVDVIKDSSVQFIDNVGQTILSVEPAVEKVNSGLKQIVAVVQYLSDLAKRENIEPKNLWMDPLPEKLDLEKLLDTVDIDNENMNVVLGMVDDPEKQTQFPFVIDMLSFHHMLLCGNSGSGKSTLVRTMLLQLVENYGTDEFNYYILDLSAGALNPFSKLPHCGAYLTDANEDDIGRLLQLVDDLVAERKEIFSKADVTNYNAYRQIGKMPLIMVVIDGYTKIKNLRRGNDYFNMMHEYLVNSVNYGIRFVLTCNHINEISSKSKQEIDYRLSLAAKDRYDYNDILNTKISAIPPEIKGRGICVVDSRPLEYQVAMPYVNENEQSQMALLRNRVKSLDDKCDISDKERVKKLPMIEIGQDYADFCAPFDAGCIPLGYSVKDMRKISIPFQQLYAMSLYFGNPIGVKPVVDNLIEAGRHNHMDMIIVRRGSDTVFDVRYQSAVSSSYNEKVVFLDSSEDGIKKLDDMLIDEIKNRNIWRDKYAQMNGIPETDKTRAQQAIRYIRERTKPLFVLFESFGDFCRAPKDENVTAELVALISRTKGYNIYFAGCFYPNEESNLISNPLMKCFNSDEFFMFFGGQYDKQNVTGSLPMELRRIEQVNPKYDRYMMKYRGEYYTMLMPCGELSDGAAEPDEASII